MPPSEKIALKERIGKEIARSTLSAIPFAQFMHHALYDPDFGYYAASSQQRVGRQGDFYTSISVGECFGKLLASHFINATPNLQQVVEQGANDGQLAADLIAHLPPGIDYVIIEPFPALRELQRGKLGERARWVDSIGQIEGGITGRFVCNELLDALPTRRVRRCGGGEWKEIHINSEFEEVPLDLSSPALADEIASVLGHRDLPEGYTTEIHLEANDWTRDLLAHLKPGASATIIDYGHEADDYYSPERNDGTLRGFREHQQVTDILDHIGETDLTTSVNFTRIAELAGATAPMIDQHHFLIEAARPWLAQIESSGAAPDAQTQKLLRQFNTLIHPGLMGRSFKVLEITAPPKS